jgi:ABC-2 type transport system permease protein
MNKIWLIFKHEYTRHVLRKRFIITVISMPLFIGVMMVASIASSMMSINRSPVGFVNHSNVLNNFAPDPPNNGFFQTEVNIIKFDSEAKADTALENKSIQAYFVLGADYDKSANAKLVYYKFPASSIQEQFSDQIQQYLIKSQPAAVVTRLTEGYHLTLVSADGSRKMGENDWINYVVLFGTGILFIVVLFTSSGYLMSALVEEKENRTMEILITSVSPDQLMAGKVLGNLSVGLTQMSVWIVTLILGYLIGKSQFNWLQNLHISIGEILTLAAIMLPGFILVAALMAMLGTTVTEAREAQQMSGLITLPIVAPYWISTPIIMNPNGGLAVALSIFPLTAPVTMSIRTAMSVVPTWQVFLSSIILFLTAAGAIWLSARAYRLGMVRYGKKVSLRELIGKQGGRHA